MTSHDTINDKGITQIAEFLKWGEAHYSREAGHKAFRLPMIWVLGDEHEGLRATEIVAEYADQRGYELAYLRRGWSFIESSLDREDTMLDGEPKPDYKPGEPYCGVGIPPTQEFVFGHVYNYLHQVNRHSQDTVGVLVFFLLLLQ